MIQMTKMKNQKIRHKHSLTVAFFMVAYMLLGIANPTFSQVYPVNATTQIAPPYSVFISDYVAPGSEQLKLNLFLRDLTEPVYDVRIRLVIEGQGVRIETSPAYNPPPVTIEGGVSTWLDAADLAPLFESRNMIFSGYSKSEFERYGRLPEGFYQFCFTVYDYQHPEIQLSQQSCQNLWLVRPDPPMLNQPACATELKLNEMQQSVIFQWTPMAISPNSSFTTDYIFRLYEIRPEGRNPADIVLSSNPIYEIQTAETSLLYGVAEPPLIPGMEYVWQVQAIDLGGRDRFKNNGYSKVCTFKVAEDEVPLPEPSEFRAWGITENMGMASWTPSLEPDGYTVEYRLADNAQAEWFVEELQLPPDAQLADSMYVVLQDLMPQTQYEVRIGSKRGAFVSSWTETKRFTTYPPRVFACGDPQDLQQPLNTTPLISAIRGEVFTVGDFKMRLTKVTGGDGVFSGYGSIETPFLGFNIAVKFDNIRVNELYQVVAGDVIALSDGIDGLIEDWEGEDDGDGTDTDEGSGGEDDGSEGDSDHIYHNGEIDTVYVDSDSGFVVVVDVDGTETPYEPSVDESTGENADMEITDSQGNTWVYKDGEVTKGGTSNDGSDTPGGIDNQFTTEERIVIAVLEDFKTRMDAWLAIYGKGPLSDYELMLLDELPGCLPEDEDLVETANTFVGELLTDKDAKIPAFTSKVLEGSDVLKNLAQGLTPDAAITNEWDKFSEAGDEVCPYIKAEAEEILNATKTYFVGYEEHNIVIHAEIAPGGFITYLTPSGTPFKLPREARPSFTGTLKSEDQQEFSLDIPRGVLLAFKDQTGTYGASFTCPPNGGACKFKGYKKAGTTDFKDLGTPANGKHLVLLGIEDADCYLRFVSGDYYYQSGDGGLISQINLANQFTHPEKVWLDREGCIPDAWSYLRPITHETFTNNVYAKYNFYGQGGVLQKLTTGDFIYSNIDEEGNHRYVRWNLGRQEWVPFDPTDPNCTSCELGQIISVWGITQLFKETGHQTLDIAGMIPGAGEAFDGINGVWYTIEGDAVNATLSFSAAAPVVGWVVTGGKWAAKVAKLGKVFKSAKELRKIELMEKLAVISERFNSLKFSDEAVKLFQKDLEETEGLLHVFLENPNLVRSWQAISKHADLRTNTKFLENISGYSDDLLKQLDEDLVNPKYSLANLFKESPDDVTEIWKKLKEDPYWASDFAKETTDARWLKWKDREFFKTVTKAGKDFEKYVTQNLGALRSKILNKYSNLDINNYEVFTQVQIKTGVGDEYFVADIVLVQKNTDEFGQVILDKSNVVVLESKLRSTTNLTTPQSNALTKVKSGANSFEVRSISKEGFEGSSISNSDHLKINDFIKVWSDGQGGVIDNIESLK